MFTLFNRGICNMQMKSMKERIAIFSGKPINNLNDIR
jgi:hypothetical protein